MATNELDTESVREIIKKLGVKRIIVGHTPKPEVEALYENQVFAIDTGNSKFYGGTLSWVEIVNDQTPAAFYVKHPVESSALRNALICRFRTSQGKSCAPYKKQ
jgi:hypothetical protein